MNLKERYSEYSQIWSKSLGRGLTKLQTLDLLLKVRSEELKEFGGGYDPRDRALSDLMHVSWIEDGGPQLTTSHTYAAALMATSVTREMCEEIRLPFKSFLITLPTGLLDDGVYVYEMAIFSTIETEDLGESDGLLVEGHLKDSPQTRFSFALFTPPGEYFVQEDVEVGEFVKDGDRKLKASVLLKRLVVGLIYTMNHTEDFTEGKCRWVAERKTDAPNHRVFVVGRPLAYDMRPAISRFLLGEKDISPPTMFTVVRGHYKRQPCGANRSERRVLWIEPYWRGPEDSPHAPILSRPRMVTS